MNYLIMIIYPIFESLWRRWFGGKFINNQEHKWFNKRITQHITNAVLTLLALFLIGKHWLVASIAVIVLEGLYWTRAHGPAFDMARGGIPDLDTLKRYKKEYWNSWCEFLVPQHEWYGYFYDFLWMFFRYEIYSIALAIILSNPYCLVLGLLVSLIYSFCWSLYEHKHIKDAPTEYAEYIVGFITGLIILL